MPDQSQDPVVNQFRDQITEIDLAILDAVNRRITTVRKLHDFKSEQGYDLTDSAREGWIVQYLERCNRGPLGASELRELFTAVLATTAREVARLRD